MHDGRRLRELIQGYIRGFGLLDQTRTPCGRRMPISTAHALLELRRHQGYMQSELAGRLGLTRSGTSRLVAGMERQKLLRREADRRDRRVYRLHLTAKGKRLAGENDRKGLAFFNAIARSLSGKERKMLVASLTALTAVVARHRSVVGGHAGAGKGGI